MREQTDRPIDCDEKRIKRSQDRQKCNENDRKRQRERKREREKKVKREINA